MQLIVIKANKFNYLTEMFKIVVTSVDKIVNL